MQGITAYSVLYDFPSLRTIKAWFGPKSQFNRCYLKGF